MLCYKRMDMNEQKKLRHVSNVYIDNNQQYVIHFSGHPEHISIYMI